METRRAITLGTVTFLIISLMLVALLWLYNHNRERISPNFPPAVQHWNDIIVDAALEFKVDRNMIAAVMTVESCGHPEVSAPNDGQGVMQVTNWWFESSKLRHIGSDPFNPNDSIRMGAAILRYNLDHLNDNVRLALAAYVDNTGLDENNLSVGAKRHYTYTFRMLEEADDPKSTAVQDWQRVLGQFCPIAERFLGV